MTNRQVQHRGGHLCLSACQTGLTENPTRKNEQAMASDKNERKTQTPACYLFYLPSCIFPLAVTTSECLTPVREQLTVPQEANGEMPTPFLPI